jgi:hypothetical protein
MQAHPEHQQHHANFGQLAGHGGIGHETRGKRANHHARQQITHQRRQPHTRCQKTQHQRQAQRGRNGVDQVQAVRHGPWGETRLRWVDASL